MTATIFKFPAPENLRPQPKTLPPLRQAPVFETFNPESGLELHTSTKKTCDGAMALVDFVRKNRDLARQAGVETLAIEITAVMAGEKFRQVLDALDDAVFNSLPLHITTEGMAVLRTVESLLAEASSAIKKHSETPALGAVKKVKKQMAAADPFPLWIPLVIFGVLSIAGVVMISTSVLSHRESSKK